MDQLITAFVTLFVTIDPAGLAPLFIALTSGMEARERRRVGFRAAIIAFVILVLFALAGTAILALFGITLPAFRIAGGLLLFVIAFEMIFEKRAERHERTTTRLSADEMSHLAVFPLAIPLLAGPGAISATILLAGQMSGFAGKAELVGVIAAILAITFGVFALGERIEKLIGDTGRMVISRLLGVILAALAVQYVADGIVAFVNAPA
ncbi:MarC family protein [Afifella sp. IM 167]|uniref:MarC family protein n=1 Tax=Afifella sp. IM 167 TaxID=2033586 RepID=UPI001CCF1E70|nr:MarC family protein [Afifella sp. IM 167]MBZ8132634.1 MarC family transcriptional regulator [Afifella sp. IM 167]